jgi:hypothetical protein
MKNLRTAMRQQARSATIGTYLAGAEAIKRAREGEAQSGQTYYYVVTVVNLSGIEGTDSNLRAAEA